MNHIFWTQSFKGSLCDQVKEVVFCFCFIDDTWTFEHLKVRFFDRFHLPRKLSSNIGHLIVCINESRHIYEYCKKYLWGGYQWQVKHIKTSFLGMKLHSCSIPFATQSAMVVVRISTTKCSPIASIVYHGLPSLFYVFLLISPILFRRHLGGHFQDMNPL